MQAGLRVLCYNNAQGIEEDANITLVAIMLNAKILVVDDDPAFCQLLEMVLRKEGAQVIVAGCCQEAVRVLDAERPDLILLDVMMPDGDGFETAAATKQAPRATSTAALGACFSVTPVPTTLPGVIGIGYFSAALISRGTPASHAMTCLRLSK